MSDPQNLRNRIYNQGFTLDTLPSVRRPPTNYSSFEPLSVRLSSLKTRLAPLIYQDQPSILHKTARLTQNNFKKSEKLSLAPLVDRSRKNQSEIPKQMMYKTVSQISLFAKPVFQGEFQGFFAGDEMKNSQLMLDKISGKKSKDIRYMHSRKNFNKKSSLHMITTEEFKINPNLNVSLRQPTRIDKYIELILKNVSNLDEFIYLIRQNSEDPYQLDVIEYEILKKSNIKDYFTISKKGLCHYENGKPSDFISLALWLKERETYDLIKTLKFFKKFRKWKTLRMWRKNLIHRKTNQNKSALENNLFILDPILRNTLLNHRQICLEMEKIRVLELSQQKYGFGTETPKLEEFQESQSEKQALISANIKDFSNNCRDNVRLGFNQSLQTLRDLQEREEQEKISKNSNFKDQHAQFRLKESAYEKLGFMDDMSYERRSELRKICLKFLRFSYLIDFLALDSLKNIYLYSIDDFINEINLCIRVKDNMIYLEKGQKGMSKMREPLFLIQVDYEFREIPQNLLIKKEIPAYMPPPLGNSEISEFNLLSHVYLNEGISNIDLDFDPEQDEIYKQSYESYEFKDLVNYWLKLSPSKELFIKGIIKGIEDNLNGLKSFERWSRHDEMSNYVSVLEEWDDLIGEDWEISDSNYLDPSSWLTSFKMESEINRMKNLINEGYNRAEKYINIFHEFLNIFWINSKVDLDLFKNKRLAHQSETFQHTLELLCFQKEKMESEIPFQADLGLLRVDSSNLRDQLLPSPDYILKKLQGFMPEVMRNRVKKAKEWFNESLIALKTTSGNLEEFVKQRNSIKNIDLTFPKIKKKIEIISQIYIQLKEFKFDIKKEDDSSLNEILHNSHILQINLGSATESIEKSIEVNASKITAQLIPELMKNVNELEFRVKNSKFLSKTTDESLIISELKSLKEEFKKFEAEGNKYLEFQKTLGMDQYDFDSLYNLKEDLELRVLMWESLTEWKLQTNQWLDATFSLINPEEIMAKAEYFTTIVKKAIKKLPSNVVLDELKTLVFDFKDTMPVVLALRNPNLKEYHWKEIKEMLGENFEIHDKFTLKDLMNLNVGKFVKEIQDISIQATQESMLEKNYDEIYNKWLALEFSVVPYKSDKAKELYLLTDMEDLFGGIDEYLASLNNILGSRFLKILRIKVEELHKKLIYTQETIDDWLVCQKNWIYLENIFDSQDIKKKLATESTQFEAVDKNFRNQMRKTYQHRFVHKCVTNDIGKIFKKQKETLNSIQKALENYLEMKRNSFPRFYFLSNDELLEILANAQNLNAIQKHMKKCFDNIYRLYSGEDSRSTTIMAMVSGEEEKIEFNKAISTRSGEIETWLNAVQDQMRETIGKKLKIGRNDLDSKDIKDRKKWVIDHPGQVIATIAQISWCNSTEYFLEQMIENNNSMLEWLNINIIQLAQLTELVRSSLDPIKHKIVVALITQDVHSRDIIETLITENVLAKTDFLWQQQLRYYWDESVEKENVYVLQVNAKLKYGYEYMGATSRLVITPLTDRCWITITGALNIKLGASPAGPAGTGKTESTKDLAKALGMFCVVFNCSEQIEYKMMAKLFSGLAQQGAWACLDEFNRIDIEVLSVIAQQLLTIRQALIKNEKKFFFVNDFIFMREGFGVFITMNPGYAGRTELPDNLKVLFRPVAMMIPDYRLIAEIILFSEGFENSKILSNKMVQLYKLSSEQLSQQKHYDFGMRAVKSVLVMAGSLKRSDQESNEDAVLIKAMRDSNIPKFLKEDIPLFQALIQDLFPDVQLPLYSYESLTKTIVQVFQDKSLQPVEKLITKTIQLFETFNVRFGVMLVGTAGAGKTTCYETLQSAMSELRRFESPDLRYQTVHTYVLNPKSITMGELYGEVNVFTEEWQDGLASQIMRAIATDEAPDRKYDKHWVVFDGPVDALWIENMNTVLDDNMMLCLANGQRIKLRQEMRMLFEVNDLDVASPATVSRCGMVYLPCSDLGWKPYFNSWLDKIHRGLLQDEYFNQNLNKDTDNVNNAEMLLHIEMMQFVNKDFKNILSGLFEDNVEEFICFIRSLSGEPIKTSDLQLVCGLCNLIECFISRKFGFKVSDRLELKKKFIVFSFIFSLIWSIGGSISEENHFKFDDLIRKKFANIIFPSTDTVYGFFLDPQNLSFKSWSDITLDFVFSKEIPYFNLQVPTIDTTRYSYILEWLLIFEKKAFLTGGTGVGKSVLIKGLLQKMKETRSIDPAFLMFSAATDSQVTQSTIESKLEKHKKTIYGAKLGRKVVIFIDDINMPAVEKYGAQSAIELLRLLIDKGGMYDRKERFWKEIQNTIILGAAAPPSGGRNEMTLRFTRHFNLLSMPQPSQKTLFKIFNNILNGFFNNNGFNDNIKKYCDNVTNATIDIYEKIVRDKKAIPSKFHYTFNLRDVSKVFQGILMCKPYGVRESESLFRLWNHEVCRVFHDRLINEEDREWFKDVVIELASRYFNSKWTKEEVFEKEKILFGEILKLDSSSRDYEEIKDINKLLRILGDKLDDYNNSPKIKNKQNLIFFEDAIYHILRITRVLSQPRGNLMLIGVGGSGKQSLTRFSTYIMGYETRQIEISKGYGQDEFREFLRKLLDETGVQGKNITFLFTDNQILNEGFLEDINNLLNSGEVSNIWEAAEDKEKIINSVRQIHIGLKRVDTPELIYSTFVERVRNYLHIVLCMSPVGSALRIRCRKFPSLVDCCTLDWFSSWSESALLSVSSKLLQDIPLISPEIIQNLSLMCSEVHQSVGEIALKFDHQLKRKVYITPKSFLDLISLYTKCLDEKREEIQSNSKRLANGLGKLTNANQLVAKLKIDLKELQPQLDEQNASVNASLILLERDSLIAREQEIIVEREKEEVNHQAEEIKTIADEAQADLDTVKPELDAADQAVKNIDQPSLVQMKTYPSPPQIVEDVMQGVCILLGKKYDWITAKNLMQNLSQFINLLLTYPKDNIKEDVLIKFRKHRASVACFNPAEIKQRALAAADLCTWCCAMDTYASVSKKVGPKRAKVQLLQNKLEEAWKILAEKEKEVMKVKANVAKLKRDSDLMLQKKSETERLIKQTTARLQNAEILTELLKEEGERWVISVEKYEQELITIIGDVFLSAAMINYCGPFTGIYRQELMNKWIVRLYEMNIPLSGETVSVVKTLGNPVILREWMINGLPSDIVSQENAIFAVKGSKFPLFIDPQMQAKKWIKKNELQFGLKILKTSETQFQTNMKSAINMGDPVLIQDIDEILDPILDSILTKQTFKTPEGRVLIRFADQDVDLNDNFKLYLTCKQPNPAFLPEIFIKVNVINFTVTFDGLQEQFLAEVVKHEEPQIEEARDLNIINLASFRKKILESENTILKLLSEAKNDTLLDDVDLIKTLQISKNAAVEIDIQIKESIELEKKIELTRGKYGDVATRGSILYFVIKDFALIDPMYQYSLQYVGRLFNNAIENTPKSNPEKRLNNLIDQITKIIYTNVCRGLFEEHKLIFSFLITTSIDRNNELISDAQWSVFLRGAGLFDEKNQPKLPIELNNEIKKNGWDLAYYLELNFTIFNGLTQNIISDYSQWKEYCQSTINSTEKLPIEWSKKLSTFEKLFLLKIFHPDQLLFGISQYVELSLGLFYLESPSLSLPSIFSESDSQTPIIFVLSQGADPSDSIMTYFQELYPEMELRIISLGQGQGGSATLMIEEGKKDGGWVYLQNCHLARTWMPSLEILVEGLAGNKDVNPGFRLILTSMPSNDFPCSVLQNGIKLTTEPPRGIKANLKRSFIDMDQEYLDSYTKGNATFQKLLWGLCYFHAIVIERRKFGPLGWNIKYEFNDSDLNTSKTVLLMLLNEQDNIPWEALLFVTGHINYGGRVTDDWDRRCLLGILKKFYNTDILEENYHFSDSDIFFIPNMGKYSDYLNYIEQLPINETPDVFGMHENANITFQTQEAEKLLNTLASIQPRITSTSSGKSNDELVLELSNTILSELSSNLTKENCNPDLFEENDQGLIPSLSTFLLQEMQRFNKLLSKIRTSLQFLIKAIQGFALMSEELDSIYYNLLNNKVPISWEDVAYPSLKPLASWIKDLKERVNTLDDWLKNGNPNCFWISGFFFPQGFLTGVLQTHARKCKIPIDQLAFNFKIMEDKENLIGKPIDGVYVYGMYLEGAIWDKKKKILANQNPGDMYYKMPVIHFNPTENYEYKTSDYICPVYKTSLRKGILSTTGQSTNFIVAVDLPTSDENTEFWILRGTALLSQLND